MSNDTVDIAETWLRAFVDVYTILIIAWIISSWVRLPYNIWVSRIRTFLDDTVSPYVAVFRRFLPMFGPLDLSPMAAIIVLQVAERILQSVLDGFRPAG
jgi:YggT family protein